MPLPNPEILHIIFEHAMLKKICSAENLLTAITAWGQKVSAKSLLIIYQ